MTTTTRAAANLDLAIVGLGVTQMGKVYGRSCRIGRVAASIGAAHRG